MNVLYYQFLFTMLYLHTEGQICKKDEIRQNTVKETYMQSFIVTYRKNLCLFKCRKTKIGQRIQYRTVWKSYQYTRNFCCDGYFSNNTDVSLGLSCDPICSPTCINGICAEPGKCQCLDGYIPNENFPHECVPVCEKSCGQGLCIAPNICKCASGYIYQNDTCSPTCSDPCINGTCVAPDSCECLPGFRKKEYDTRTCYPYCSNCGHGTCVGPESCVCDESWFMSDEYVCSPRCSPGCGFGFCVEPNKCQCHDGYTNLENGTCVPLCTKGCVNGNCVSPDVCICNEGWHRPNDKEFCEPFCKLPCGNGTCVGPNLCKCSDGYELDVSEFAESTNHTMCRPKCVNCGGICAAPNKCICEEPYYAINITVNGEDCECFDNCSIDTQKCSRTICIIQTTDTDTSITSDFYGLINVTFADENGITDSSEITEEDTEEVNETAIVFGRTKNDDSIPIWIYIALSTSVVSILLITIITLIIKRNTIIRYISGGSYVVEGDGNKDKTEPIEMKSC